MDVPGAAAQLGEAALLFDPLCPEDMAEKIAMVLSKPKCSDDLRNKGLKRAAAWSVDNFASGMIQIFNEFAGYRRSWAAGTSPT